MRTNLKRRNNVTRRRRGKTIRIALWILIISMVALFIVIGYSRQYQYQIYPLHYGEEIITYAGNFHLDPHLVEAIIYCESRFDEKARSPKGALGLMQLMPKTANWITHEMGMAELDEAQIMDPNTNIYLGCWYLKYLSDCCGEDVVLIAASYNAGLGRVKSWLKDSAYTDDSKTLKVIPFKETDEYVKRVKNAYQEYQVLYPVVY